MNKKNKSSRRSFLGKVGASTVALTIAPGIGQKLFSGEPVSSEKFDFKTKITMDSEKKFVPVMITPFNSNKKIDFDVLTQLTDFYLASGAKGFFANCLSSEMYQLDNEERLALARHVVKQVNGKVPIVATGSFGRSIGNKAEFTKRMYDTGVKAIILVTSHFAGKHKSDTTFMKNMDTFLTLTDPIPLGTYECPSPYKRILTPEVFRQLLQTNRFIYHKDTSLKPEKIKVKLEAAKGSRLEFYDAHTPNTVSSLQMGAKGMSCIAGNFYPEIFVWMCNNANDPNRQAEVRWLQAELTLVDSIISQNYPVSSKYFLQKRGIPIELISRMSKTSLNKKTKETLNKVYNVLLEWHQQLGIQIPS